MCVKSDRTLNPFSRAEKQYLVHTWPREFPAVIWVQGEKVSLQQ